MNGRGKFEIPGFPNKLGILLDGPPGLGKKVGIVAVDAIAGDNNGEPQWFLMVSDCSWFHMPFFTSTNHRCGRRTGPVPSLLAGTGKTSLIKALAIYLKRHIVSVSLEKVKTNQDPVEQQWPAWLKVS